MTKLERLRCKNKMCNVERAYWYIFWKSGVDNFVKFLNDLGQRKKSFAL